MFEKSIINRIYSFLSIKEILLMLAISKSRNCLSIKNKGLKKIWEFRLLTDFGLKINNQKLSYQKIYKFLYCFNSEEEGLDEQWQWIMKAAETGTVELIDYLVNRNLKEVYEVWLPSKEIFNYAARLKTACLLRYLIEKCEKMQIKIEITSETLMNAMYSGSIEPVRYLLKEIPKKYRVMPTPKILNDLIISGKLHLIIYLTEEAPKNYRIVFGLTELRSALLIERYDIAYYFVATATKHLRISLKQETLDAQAFLGDLVMVRYLIVEAPGNLRLAPTQETLENACYSGNVLLVQFLLEYTFAKKLQVIPTEKMLYDAIHPEGLELVCYLVEKAPRRLQVNPTRRMLERAKKLDIPEIYNFLEKTMDEHETVSAILNRKIEEYGLPEDDDIIPIEPEIKETPSKRTRYHY